MYDLAHAFGWMVVLVVVVYIGGALLAAPLQDALEAQAAVEVAQGERAVLEAAAEAVREDTRQTAVTFNTTAMLSLLSTLLVWLLVFVLGAAVLVVLLAIAAALVRRMVDVRQPPAIVYRDPRALPVTRWDGSSEPVYWEAGELVRRR